jgi:RNA polymerase sigma-70 factor (ECF subfamily)
MEVRDRDLVEEARGGDVEAFRALVERHSTNVFRTAYRITGNRQTAEDLVQETFLKIHRQLPRFDSRAKFGTWLYRIATNCAIDHVRKEKRRAARALMEGDGALEGMVSAQPGADRLVWSAEVGRIVRRVLAELSPRERAAFVMRHYEGRSIAEIAELLGIRTNACKSTVFRAVSKLRTALAPVLAERAGEESHESAH